MSNYVTINNSTYEFNAFLANGNDKGSILPIPKSIIEQLEIEDSLSFPGLRGTISISNFFGILQKLEMFDISNDINLLSVSISNKDTEETDALPIKLAFDAILGEAGENSYNIVDKKLIFNFEEFEIGYLRNRYIDNTSLGDGTCSDYIKKVILTGLGETELKNVFQVEQDTNDILNTSVPAPAGSIVKQTQSCYEVLRLLLRHCYFDEGIPALLQIHNVYEDKDIKRKYKLTNLGKFISEFYTKISSNSTDLDLSKYLLETFIAGDATSSRTFGANFIDKYDIIRPNLKTVLSKKWVDYNIAPQSCSVDGLIRTDPFTFEYAKNLFETQVLGDTYAANLPDRSISSVTTGASAVSEQSNNAADNTSNVNAIVTVIPEIVEWQNAIKAMILKSFIYDNTAITFKVPGGLHREAGYFIQVKVEQNQEIKDKTQDISGYYFVISIKHIFSGENYQNEIVAVKLNKNQKLNKNATTNLISNLISGTGKASEATNTTSVATTSEKTSNVITTPNTATTTVPGVVDTSSTMETESLPGVNTEPKTEGEIQQEVEQYGLLPPI
jgi:hypothetical protein